MQGTLRNNSRTPKGLPADRPVVLAVGGPRGGRGFVIETRLASFVVTAAHCLPVMPKPQPFVSESRIGSRRLLSALGAKASVVADWYFVDPVADIAVLGEHDDFAEEFQALVKAATPLPVGVLRDKMFGELDGWLLSVDRTWFRCAVTYHDDGPLWLKGSRDIAPECQVRRSSPTTESSLGSYLAQPTARIAVPIRALALICPDGFCEQ